MIDELLKEWERYQPLRTWPATPIRLWAEKDRGIYIANSRGPVVPYPPVQHADGNKNHGYVRLKSNFETIGKVPEVQGWPELQAFLEIVNAVNSPIESLGCEKGYFPREDGGSAKVILGSYVDVTFSNIALSENPESLLQLAVPLVNAVEGCERWRGYVDLGLQRLRCFLGSTKAWGLMIRVQNDGRTEEEARKWWGESLRRLGEAIGKLPPTFPN